jgi:hypothetical protein
MLAGEGWWGGECLTCDEGSCHLPPHAVYMVAGLSHMQVFHKELVSFLRVLELHFLIFVLII